MFLISFQLDSYEIDLEIFANESNSVRSGLIAIRF